jgi:hypothetical protein
VIAVARSLHDTPRHDGGAFVVSAVSLSAQPRGTTMPKKKTLTRIERAQRLYEHARMEIAYVRDLDAALRDEGKALTPYLKQQAVDIARFLVRKGREFQYTTAPVKIRADLKSW